jgi:hypothetical protein
LGKVGQAFSFDGVNDRISVPDDEAFELTRSISVEAWIAPTAYPAEGTRLLILFRGDNRIGLDPYAFQVWPDGRIGFYVASGTALTELVSSTSVPLNTFSHVAGTLDDATGEMRVYIDGVLRGSTTTAVRALGDLDSASHPGIGIGNHGSFPNTSYNYPFAGRIDELALYNRSLTMTEIQNIYQAGSGNNTPVAVADEYSMYRNGGRTLQITAPGVLANDTDSDGDTLTATLVSGIGGGSLTLNPDGSFSFRPRNKRLATYTFTYTVSDGTTTSQPATVTIRVLRKKPKQTRHQEAANK